MSADTDRLRNKLDKELARLRKELREAKKRVRQVNSLGSIKTDILKRIDFYRDILSTTGGIKVLDEIIHICEEIKKGVLEDEQKSKVSLHQEQIDVVNHYNDPTEDIEAEIDFHLNNLKERLLQSDTDDD